MTRLALITSQHENKTYNVNLERAPAKRRESGLSLYSFMFLVASPLLVGESHLLLQKALQDATLDGAFLIYFLYFLYLHTKTKITKQNP